MSFYFKKTLTGIIFALIFFSLLIFLPSSFFSAVLALIALICSYEFVRMFPFNRLWAFLILPVYPLLSFFLLILMSQAGEKLELFLLFISVFSFDTGAYLFGKKFGRRKISQISPNKTWEGFIGGLLTTYLILVILSKFFDLPLNFIYLFFVSSAISTIAQVGDLFESWFKRRAGIKDSGILLPGHGGFLDRFDGVIFVTPFFYFITQILYLTT